MTTREGQGPGIGPPDTFRGRWLAFLGPQAAAPDPAWVNVWRWAVAVSLVTSAVRSGGLATHLSLGSVSWYALQFLPLAVATLATVRSGHLGEAPRWPARLLTLLVLCAAVSVLFAADRHQVMLQVALFAAATVFLLSTYLLRWSDARTREIDLRCVYWVFVGIHVVGLVAFAAGASAFVGDFNRYLGVMSNANYAGMTAALALTLAFSSKRAIDLVGAIPLALALYVSGSRGAVLGLAFAVVVIAVQRRWFTREWLARRRLDGERLRRGWHRTPLVVQPVQGSSTCSPPRVGRPATGRAASSRVGHTARGRRRRHPRRAERPHREGPRGRERCGAEPLQRASGRRCHLWPTGDLSRHARPLAAAPGLRVGLPDRRARRSALADGDASRCRRTTSTSRCSWSWARVGLLVFGCLLLSILLAGRWSHALLAAAACALVLELTESAMFGFGGPSALLTWMVLLGFASTGAAGRARAPASDPARE